MYEESSNSDSDFVSKSIINLKNNQILSLQDIATLLMKEIDVLKKLDIVKLEDADDLRNKNNVESRHDLTNTQLAVLKSTVLLLMKEIELLKKLETNFQEEYSDEDICLTREIQSIEISLIRNALVKAGGVQRKAAKSLGIKVTTLHEKIKRFKNLKIDLEDINFSN